MDYILKITIISFGIGYIWCHLIESIIRESTKKTYYHGYIEGVEMFIRVSNPKLYQELQDQKKARK